MHSSDWVTGAVPTTGALGEGRVPWFSEKGGDGISPLEEFSKDACTEEGQSIAILSSMRGVGGCRPTITLYMLSEISPFEIRLLKYQRICNGVGIKIL